MRRAFVFRMRPTAGQHRRLGACLESHRELYNAALQERRDAWAMCRIGISYGVQSAQLKEIRALRPDVAIWSFSSQQATLRRLNKAFAAFFRRVKAKESHGYPRFKTAHRFESVEWPSDGDGCRWRPNASRVYLQGIGHIKVSAHRQVQGRVKTLSVKRQGRKWMLVISCDEVPAETAGSDPLGCRGGRRDQRLRRGLRPGFAEGGLVPNPRWARASAARLAAAQRALSTKKQGSANRRAARDTAAARHRKIANRRADFHHKLARALVEGFGVIVVEDLAITNMVRSARGSLEDAGSNVAAKKGLNRSIADAGLGSLRVDPQGQSGRSWPDGDRREPRQHQSDLPQLLARRRWQPHTRRVQLSGLRSRRPRGPERSAQHPPGWAGPSDRYCGLKRIWRLQPSEKSPPHACPFGTSPRRGLPEVMSG